MGSAGARLTASSDNSTLAQAPSATLPRSMRSLDLRTENGRDSARASIRLVDSARLLLDFDGEKSNEVTVVGIIEADTQEVAP